MSADAAERDLVKYRQAGASAAMQCACIGMALAAILLALFGMTSMLRSYRGWLLLIGSIVTELWFAREAGGVTGGLIKTGKNPWLCGIGLAYASVVVPTLIMSLAVWSVSEPIYQYGLQRPLRELGAYVLRPLAWVGGTALIPAPVLGIVYALLVRRAHRRIDTAASG